MKKINYIFWICLFIATNSFAQVLINDDNPANAIGAALAINGDYLIVPRNEAGLVDTGTGVLVFDKGDNTMLVNDLVLTKNLVRSTDPGAVMQQEITFDTGIFVAPDGDSSTTPDLSDAAITDTGRVVIGAGTSAKTQALVIDSNNLGLKLPNCPASSNAPVGGICYDETSDAVKVFNGTNFYYLRAR